VRLYKFCLAAAKGNARTFGSRTPTLPYAHFCRIFWGGYRDGRGDEKRLVPFRGQKPFHVYRLTKIIITRPFFHRRHNNLAAGTKRRLNFFSVVFIPNEWTNKCLGLEEEFSIQLRQILLDDDEFFYCEIVMNVNFLWSV
jgi:hypothetical protein